MTKSHCPISKFGKDHWSLLGYIESRIVDNHGMIDFEHCRINIRNGIYPANSGCRMQDINKPYEYPSRLFGYFEDKNNPDKIIPEQDDMGCIRDFELEEIIEPALTMSGPYILTDKGREICHKLRDHKAAGKQFAEFVFKE